MEEEKEPLKKAEELIAQGELDEAQKILNGIKENRAREYYLQSLVYKEKKWYSEQRKQLEQAVIADPDNEEYKKELQELEEFAKTKEYKKAVKKNEMGKASGKHLDRCYDCCSVCESIADCF